MSDINQQQTLAVAAVFEAAEETAKRQGLAPNHTAAALAIAAGAYGAGVQEPLEVVLDLVTKAYGGARAGLQSAGQGQAEPPAEVVPAKSISPSVASSAPAPVEEMVPATTSTPATTPKKGKKK